MNISKEFLMEAVGLSLLVALILIGMQMFQKTVRIATLLQNHQEQNIAQLEEYDLVKYEDLILDGMTALSYIKNVVGEYQVPVIVEEKQKKFSVTGQADFGLLRDIDSEKYICPYALYKCKVIRDENNVITEINLVREQEGD